MSSEIEFKGKSVEKAVQEACQQLDIKEENIKYDVISYGSTGIFGLVGTRKAKIRVTIQEKPTDREKDEPGAEPAEGQRFKSDKKDAETDKAATCGEEALQKIADGVTDGAWIITENRGNRIYYNIKGGKPGVLIGKRGQTLEAIQYIVEKVVNRNSKERVRISIDVGGYLANKKKNLESLARRTARKAKKNGKPATIGQLNAHDRRIVHLALKNDSEVTTKSVGDGFLRKLVVLPKMNRGSQRRNN